MTEICSISPQAITASLPFAKTIGFFFATFVLEDVAATGAGLLLARGYISWPAAFAACFLGIWLGDAGLYGLARFAGHRRIGRWFLDRISTKVVRSERWFSERGTAILVLSRLVPGARLPTYLAAGFLRVPASRFLLITGVASFAWTFAILFLARTFGARLSTLLRTFKLGGLTLVGGALILFAALRLLRRIFANFDSRKFFAWLGRWRHWEFWPAWMFYPPVAIYCLGLAVKHRGLTLPTAANPGIFSGGMVGESKMMILRELMATSREFTAEAELLTGATPEERLSSLQEICERRNILFPFILKPDVGQRGLGVKLITDKRQAVAYLKQTSAPLLIQRFAEGPGEVGIFYYRFPHEPRGHIFAITEKIFPLIAGDGQSTVAELIWRDPRARFMANKYLSRLGNRKDEVLPAGKTLKLLEAGNHAQGCIFRDGMHLCTPALAERVDVISQKLTGFNIGRYDVRFSNQEDLGAGRSFQIIELNGAASEATNIYDARNSLITAYRTLFRQWDLVFAIGAANRKLGCAPTKLSLVWQKWREYSRQASSYPAAD